MFFNIIHKKYDHNSVDSWECSSVIYTFLHASLDTPCPLALMSNNHARRGSYALLFHSLLCFL